jgi:flagellin-like protein
MNVFGKNERSWRKARKRGVSPIIATILLVAITVVLAAVLYVLISGLTHGPGSAPLGTNFGWGAGTAQTNATSASPSPCSAANGISITATYCYTIQITGVGGGISTSNVLLALRGASGATVSWPAAADIGVSLLSPTAVGYVATYTPSTSTWTAHAGFSGVFASGMTVVIGFIPVAGCGATSNCGMLSNSIEAVGQSGYSGVVTSTPFT